MELLYIWIEDYKNIKRQGFNFSPLYDFEFKYELDDNGNVISGELKDNIKDEVRAKRESHYKDFFGKGISNVTAILGENGSGKSSLLEALFILNHPEYKGFFILKNESKKESIYKIASFKLENETNFSVIEVENALDIVQYFNVIYYANNFSAKKNLIEKTKNDKLFIESSYFLSVAHDECFFYEELKKEVNYIKYLSKKGEYTYKYVLFWLNEKSEEQTKILKIKNMFIEHICEQGGDFEKYRKKVSNILKKNQLEKLDEYVEIVLENYLIVSIDKASDFIKTVKELEDSIKLIYLPIDEIKDWTILDEEMVSYSDNLSPNENLVLSYGEQGKLSLFARIYHALSKIDNDLPTIMILDEADLGVHPQWQKALLKDFIDFIHSVKDKIKKTIQLIITSHSPFLVSDLPKENVIFLEKDADGLCQVSDLEKHKATFGANIHTLFTDSFFMKGGLIGDFAAEKINEAIDILENTEPLNTEKIQFCEFIIGIIGEPILKRQLQKMLDSKRLQKIDKHENEIDELKKRIAELETKTKNL